MPKLSIGVPVCNAERTVRRTLERLLAQSETSIEVIVSDNASTDGTFVACADIAASDSRVRLFRQGRNIGAAMNFQYVLDRANCEFFMWAAGNDFHSCDFAAALVESFAVVGSAGTPRSLRRRRRLVAWNLPSVVHRAL